MALDTGTLLGIASGLQQGADAFTSARKEKRAEELEAQKMGLLREQNEFERQQKQNALRSSEFTDLARSGRIPQYDEKGLLTGSQFDPEYLKMKRSEQMNPEDQAFKLAQIEKMRAETNKLNREPKEVQTAAAKAAQKQGQEVDYRVNTIQGNLTDLENLIKANGTWEAIGPHNSELDKKIYNIAVDYAKLVDPDSVAREGEVSAAQKYMLPIQGLGVKNDTALSLIKKMKADVETRKQNLFASKGLLGGEQMQVGQNQTSSEKNEIPVRAIIVKNGKQYEVQPDGTARAVQSPSTAKR